jgi:MFS transporter, DHA1 family, solute carrier family 18 (vesicular amine transporter), member 1/2
MLAHGKFWPLMAVVSFALLMDYFIYGLVTSLADHSPGHATGEGQFGLLHGGYAVGVLTAAPLFGYLGVRIGLKYSMICGVALSAAATALFGIAPGSALLFLAQLLQGAAAAATWTAGLSLVAQHHVERRVEMMGYALIGSTAGSLLGNVAGGLLGQIGGDHLPFLVAGALVAIDAGLRVFVLPSDRTCRQSFADLSALLLSKPVLMSAAAVGLAAIGWSIVDTLLPARLGRAGVAPPTIGLIFVAASIVYGVCAPLAEWVSKRAPIGRVIAGGTLAMAMTLPLLGIVQGMIATAAAVCVVSVCYAFMLDPTTAELGNAVDRRGMTCYSAVYAVFNVAYAIGMVAIDGTSSVAANRLDFPQVLLGVSVALILATPFLWHKA